MSSLVWKHWQGVKAGETEKNISQPISIKRETGKRQITHLHRNKVTFKLDDKEEQMLDAPWK